MSSTPALVSGVIRVTVVRCEALANRDSFGKQDPYVKLAIKGQTNPRSKGQTSVVKKGGTDVVFTDAHNRTHELVFEGVSTSSPFVVSVEALDEDVGSADDVIGVGEVDLSRYLGAAGVEGEETCHLRDAKGASCGRVVVHVRMVSVGVSPSGATGEGGGGSSVIGASVGSSSGQPGAAARSVGPPAPVAGACVCVMGGQRSCCRQLGGLMRVGVGVWCGMRV